MPQIREYTSQVSPQGQIGGRRADAEDFSPIRGTLAVADTLTKLAGHYDNLRRESLLSTETVKAQQELQEFAFTLKNGTLAEDGTYTAPPDPLQHETLLQNKVKEINARVKGTLGDNELYSLYERDFSQTALRESFKVRENAIGRQREAITNEFATNLQTLADMAANEEDVPTQLAIRNKMRTMTSGLVASGVMSPDDGFKAEKSFDRMVVNAQVRRAMRDNPEAALTALLGDGFPQLTDPAEREKWIDQAGRRLDTEVRRRAAEEERTRRQEDKAQREMEEQTAKDGYALAAENQLTPSWVEQNRGNLGKADYVQLLNKAKGFDVNTDPKLYTQLRSASMAGKNVKGAADRAYLNGQLARPDYDRILQDMEQSGVIGSGGGGEGKKDPVLKAGEDYIKTSMNAEGPQTDGITRMRAARAVDDWRDWRRAHPDAGWDEAQKQYRRMTEDATLLDDKGNTAILVPPRYAVGSRQAPDLAATVQATKKAFDAGQIDKWEYDHQLKLISDWQKQMGRKPPTPPKTGK